MGDTGVGTDVEGSTASRAEEVATTEPSVVGIPTGYRPALDGIRAIAVMLVVLYHVGLDDGLDIVPDGWLGVDVFFVLSGYLITSLLLTEHDRQGRISLRNFYLRRFLRLAPLAVALVLALFALHWLRLDHRLGLRLPLEGGLSVLFYFSNWWGMNHPARVGSLGHAWSLSIEEQFYFVWPVLVVCAFRVFRRSARQMLIVFIGAAFVAMGVARWLYWLTSSGPTSTYHGRIWAWRTFYASSLLRPDGLLIGCLLALVLHRVVVTDRLRRFVGAAGLVALIVAAAIVCRSTFPGRLDWIPVAPTGTLSLFNLATATVVAWLVVAPRTPFARLLSLAPFTWVGRRAYGIYLLQPLVLAVVVRHASLRRVPLEVVLLTATFVAAGLSFRFFETPFLRLKERFGSR